MSLRSLSDNEILSRILRLTRHERSLTLAVLLHLNEIERRRLHLKLGYASMYAYCTSGLGYSNSAASRRIRTARCVARFPEVYALLETNEVNVSTIAQVSRILTAANKDEVLSRIRGKSQRDVETIAAEYEPRESIPRDRVRSVVVRVPAVPVSGAPGGTSGPGSGRGLEYMLGGAIALVEAPATEHTRPAQTPANEHDRNGRVAGPRDDTPAVPEPTARAVQLEKRAMVEFCATEAFMARLERLRSLMWHRLPVSPSMEDVLSFALEYVIEREDPEKRRTRRSRRPERTTPRPSKSNPRHILATVRDTVFARDKGRCTFVGPTGRRCGSTQALQVDHITPVARGGSSTPSNLRLLCAYHNRLEAERIMGQAGRSGEAPNRS
ncbi:MAG: HNH endonuclease [Candidatus Krumholzibacteria bacterium]|nr:HNH endonuclease [Candidatus Krumholzibacteria bacterium]MDH4351107.1 HNH endonuclease [Gemmatimonadota bacterium]